MKQHRILHEYVRRGESGYPFSMYSSNSFSCDHWHEELEIIYVTKGALSIRINGVSYQETADSVLIVNQSEIHSMHTETEDTEYFALVFDPHMLELTQSDSAQNKILSPFIDKKLRFFNKPEQNKEITDIIKQITTYQNQHKSGYTLAVKGLLLTFFALLFSNAQYETVTTTENYSLQLIKRITFFIDQRLTQQISLNVIANEFNMSPKYFCRIFKKHLSVSLMEYINRKRVECATHLLVQTDNSVTEIAFACGFSNASYFARTFKRFTDYTPTEYRNHSR